MEAEQEEEGGRRQRSKGPPCHAMPPSRELSCKLLGIVMMAALSQCRLSVV